MVRAGMLRAAAAGCGLLAAAGAARAGSIDFGEERSLEYKMTVSYGLAVRTGSANQALINGPVDAFQSYLFPVQQPGQPPQIFSFTHSGLPTTINYDDGDRNFKSGSLINNRATALAELQLHWDNYGIVTSGDGFYDQAYHRPNGNDSGTANVQGPSNRFTDATRYYDGRRFRLLDAYAYADWAIGDYNVDLRVGQQLVAWGQSLFFSGIALAQSRADATKAFVPGAEIKSILLPTNQVSLRLGISNDLTMVGYYKLAYRSSEIFPEGDYFSPADAVGPGATFVYGSANPFYGGPGECPGLLTNFHIGNTPVPVTPALENLVCNVIFAPIGAATGAPRYIDSTRGPDLKPSSGGQWGAGFEYQVLPRANIALYYLRYHDTNPAVNLNIGFAPFTTNPRLTTQIINQYVPTTYNVKYFDGIHMIGSAFSTTVGPFNVAGELNYRYGVDMPVQAEISGVLSPVFTRGKLSQALLSAIYVTNPHLFFDSLALTGEAGDVYVNSIDRVAPSPGIETVGDGRRLFYSRNSWAVNMLAIPVRHNLISGWDFSAPVSFGSIVRGNPSMAGAFGALYGEGDTRLGVSLNMQYLGNLEIGIGYNFFFGDPNKTIGNSLLKANPYMDRDYATFHVTYDL